MAMMAETHYSTRTFSPKKFTAIKWILEDYSILEHIFKNGFISNNFSITETKEAYLRFVPSGIDKAAAVSLRLPRGLEASSLITDISIIDPRSTTKLMTKREIFAAQLVGKSRRFLENAELSSQIIIRNNMLHNDILTLLCEVTIIESVLISPMKKICPALPVAKILPTLPQAMSNKCCDNCIVMNKSFYDFFESKILCDVTFIIGATKFDAHKLVLAKHSPVLKYKFEKDSEYSFYVIEISQYDEITFEAFLKFIYTGTISGIEKIVDKLLLLANEYQVTTLVEECQKYMIKSLTISNVIDYLLFAHTHNFEHLKRRAVELAKTNGEFAKCENFHKLCQYPDLIVLIIQKP